MNPQDIQPPASPLGSFPELAAMYRSSFQLPLSNAQVGSQSAKDQVTLANEKLDAEAAKRQQAFLSDPKNYQQIQRADGGYGFYDPSGKEISAADYASITGKSPTDILKNSTNPIDMGFQKDHEDLQQYVNLKLQSNRDSAAAQKAQAIEADVKQNTGIDIAKLTPDQLVQAFKAAYPTIYGQGGFQGAGTAGVPVGHTFIPQATDSFVQNTGGGAFNL